MDIVFNKEGTPIAFAGKTAVGFTQPQKLQPEAKEAADYTFTFKNIDFVSWGNNNYFPDEADSTIRKTGVLNTGLAYKSRVGIGQGCMPVNITGYDNDNNEILQVVDNPELIGFLNDYVFRGYHAAAFRDLFKFGNVFPVFVFNADYNKILRVEARNARHCRLSKDKTKMLVYGNFKNGNPSDSNRDWQLYDLLDEADPFTHLENLRADNKLQGKNIAFPRIKNFFSNNDYYGSADWQPAFESGWIDIALQIPKFLKKAYSNAMHLKWHIRIPYSYWEKQFPVRDFSSTEERKAKIEEYMNKLEDDLTGEENADKAIISQFNVNEMGKAEEKWDFERLDSKINVDEKLATSAAANSEILFSLMVNPSVLGAGMPGGPYAGNAGSGSDIREGLTTSILLSHIEKQQVLDPVELMLRFNGYKDIQIKYRNTVLTTLNTGKSTQTNLE